MAEGELEGLEKQLESLLSRYSSEDLRADSKPFCSVFYKLVEECASRWQVPLPQLRILKIALCHFSRASTFFTLNCEHVLHTLSSLALSVFELLLFFEQKDFQQEPLKHFTVTFQECYHSALGRHQNVHLLQVERSLRGGGPWAGPALQAILSESSLPQSEADGCINSELPVFFELRVRYLLSCDRVNEAITLAKCCAQHPTAGQHLFFLQVYLTWLFKTSQHDRLHKEVAEFNGKDAVHIICSLECEEKDELLLALCRAFLSQQLRRGDMYYLCDLVFVWSKLHNRLDTSKQALLEESHQLMLLATNVSSIFPFIRAILKELGDGGIQFCVELCANALGSCLPCDVTTKSLIYKTIAGLLPNDLEVSRACALLVFFLERTVETYKMVYLLYMHPDQEYQVEYSPIRNHVRFETLQVLKKDLYFDPEFWNLIALRTNCLKLMGEKVVSAALEEIMEDKWILSYNTKESTSRQKGSKGSAAKKRLLREERHHKDDTDTASKRLKVGPGKTRLQVDHAMKKKGNQGSPTSEPLRRSFWQLDKLQENVAREFGELRRTTRLSEKNPPKRMIRKPKWLVEDTESLKEMNVLPKIKKHVMKHQHHHASSVVRRSGAGELKNNAKHKSSVNSHLMSRRNNSKHQRRFLSDSVKPATPPEVILELSLPDNELLGTFTEDSCNRQRGLPQVLLYRPTVKVPAASQPVKTVHRKEVILRARDAAMFAQQLHCYARRQKGKGSGPNIQGSVSTITRSSVQGSPPKDPQRELCEKPSAEGKVGIAAQSSAQAEVTESPALNKVLESQTTKAVSQKTFSARELSKKLAAEVKVTDAPQTIKVTEAPVLDKALQDEASAKGLCEESAVEMKVTIASTATAGLEKFSKAQTVKDASKTPTSAVDLQTQTAENNKMEVTDKIPPVSNIAGISNTGAAHPTPSQSQDVHRDEKHALNSLFSQAETSKNPAVHAKAATPEVPTTVNNSISEVDVPDVSPKPSKGHVPCDNETSRGTVVTTYPSAGQDSLNDISSLTLVTEMVTELAPEDGTAKESTVGSKSKAPCKLRTTSSSSDVADVQGDEEGTQDIGPEAPEDSKLPESEESKLEYCCTFCNKVFKGSRVVAHAMFHYRRDECMFCGTMFRDDLLAMMHLSDHIETLKRIKESGGNDAQDNCVPETKDISTPKTAAKAKAANLSSGRRSSGRTRTSTDCVQSGSLPESTPSGSRKLRSDVKPVNSQPLHKNKQNTSKHLNRETSGHKVNGHIGKKELNRPKKDILNSEAKRPPAQQEIFKERANDGAENPRLQANQDTVMDSSATSVQVDKEPRCSTEHKRKATESLQVTKKGRKEVVEEKNAEPQEKVYCPVEGCAWLTDKNRVTLLYHALEDHYGEVKPLELAFSVGNGKCSCCMRVMWSFEHFQHHVERHRLAPRHPCPHQGCTARFKSGMEMRRHARRHSPLQAVCCLPGCSQLFICLWALNLHEREHYGSSPTKPDQDTNEQAGDKHNTPDHKAKDATANSTVNKTVSIKAARKLVVDAHSSSGKHVQAPPPPTTVSTSQDSHVLKNLSNKDTSTQSTGPSLRLRQTLRKDKVTNPTVSHRVISSSLLRHSIKVRHKFKKKQVRVNTKRPKRRGRPPKSKKPVRDENATDANNPTAQLTGPQKAAGTSNESKRSKEPEESQQVQDVVKATETSSDESKSKKSANKQMKKKHVKQKGISRNSSSAVGAANSLNRSIRSTSADKAQKLTADKKVQRVKKASAPKDHSSQTAPSGSSKPKKHKVTNNKADAKIVQKKYPLTKKPVKSIRDGPPVETGAAAGVESSADEERAKAEKADSTQSDCARSLPAVPADSLNVITAPPSASATGKTKKSQVKKAKSAASSDSGKTVKKQKEINKIGDKKTQKGERPRKDASKTSALKKKTEAKSVEQQAEAGAAVQSSPDVERKPEEGTTLDSGSSIPAATPSGLDESTPPPAATEGNTQEAAKESAKSHVTETPDPNKAKKRKNVHEEGDATIVKKCKEQTEIQPSMETKAAAEAEEAKTPPTTISSRGYSLITNGQAVSEDAKPSSFQMALAEYGKKPFLRLPPTAYLDEKYITMPKRRKELSFLPSYQRCPPSQQASAATTSQRQRCANCFATFNSAEDLQSHLQLQKCSNLFGFDSDDEGNS